MSLVVPADLLSRPTAASTALVEVATDMAALRAEWLCLESRALASAYQSFDFLAAWVRHASAGAGVGPRLGMVRDHAGRLVGILPFGVKRRGLARIGVYLGGSHANFGLPLFDAAYQAQLDRTSAETILADYCRVAGLDGLYLANQPQTWRGVAHPFAAAGWRQPSPSDGYLARFPAVFDDFVAERLSKDRASKFNRKKRRLLSTGGHMDGGAADAASRDQALTSFLTQKAAQFERMGVANPFREPGVVDFLRACLDPVDGREPALTFFSLVAEGEPIAVAGGLRSTDQFSLMLMSYDSAHPFAKQSPGEVLLADTMARLHGAGVTAFDFGVGEALYKCVWSSETVPMVDVAVARSAVGHAALGLAFAKRRLIREIKRREPLFALARRLKGALDRKKPDAPGGED